ncbi:MAG: serine/threonine protein kinase [Planctomycetes bacterium]|nr:serine/threonine protein kinase [Planctomycetota bacterium]
MSNPSGEPDRTLDLFGEALRRPAADRDEFLARECRGDDGLRRELESLLRLHQEAEDLLPDPSGPVVEQPGDRIGRYELLQQIGEGGFGTVWMAEQEEPVVRKVALKVLKAGMDTAQVVGRFEAERQALAMMDHPNIAKVFDGGATPQGRPYFVMELVNGIPITRYCDEAGLTPPQRLELFMPVCQAVQHAHQKGVIHRDLKPSNVLVTLHDGRPVPKVIDFGIAKATQGRLTDRTVFTGFQQMLGTPEYMAPEQAELSGLDVDTRADIYSLGVLLYELLTGTRPFELKTLLQVGYAEIVRTIKEVDPPKPSTRISTMGDQVLDVARQRSVNPRALGTLMRGDLDWIVMKALEKERSRRYQTATALGDDVLRHLHHEPVLAGPPSRWYRWRKYVRRHRIGVAAGSAIGLALLGGGSAAGWGYLEASERARQARAAEDKAAGERAAAVQARADEQAQRQRAEEREAAATREATKSQHLVDLLQEMLAGSDPEGTKDKDYRVRDLLDDFDRGLGNQLATEPEVELALRHTLARSYLALGLPDRATHHLERAQALAAGTPGVDALEAVRIESLQAQSLMEQGRNVEARSAFAALIQHHQGRASDRDVDTWRCQLANCARLQGDFQYAVEVLEALAAELGARSGDQCLGLAQVQQFLSVALMDRNDSGDLERAEQLARECLATQRERLPADDPMITASLNNLATVLWQLGGVDEVRELFQEVLERQLDRYEPDHPEVAASQAQLGWALSVAGRTEEAEALLGEAVAAFRKRGGRPLDLASALNLLGQVSFRQGHLQEAIAGWTEALAIRRRELGDHDSTARSLQSLGIALNDLGRGEEAVPLLEEALAMRMRLHREDHLEVARAQTGLAGILVSMGRLAEAEALLQASVATLRRDLPPHHPEPAATLSLLARARFLQGRFAAARDAAEEALQAGRSIWSPQDPMLPRALTTLARASWEIGELSTSEAAFAELVALLQRSGGGSNPLLIQLQTELCQVLLDQGAARAEAAELQADVVLATLERSLPRDHPLLARPLVMRAGARLLAGRLDEAEADVQRALGLCLPRPEPDASLAQAQVYCADFLLGQGRVEEAEPLIRASLEFYGVELPDDYHRWMASSLLAGLLVQQGYYADAEPLLEQAWQGLPKSLRMPDGRARRQTLERLVQLYENWDRPEQAAAWRQQLSTLGDGH